MRLSAALAVIFAFGTSCIAQDVARSWYPLQPGNSWTCRNESLSGDMVHPTVERWTTQETVVSAVRDSALGGTMVTKRTKLLSTSDAAKGDPPESHLLIRQDCVYEIARPWTEKDLIRGDLPPSYCFPFARGATWGGVPHESPAVDYVWNVMGIDEDPFGLPGGNTFHVSARAGSGTHIDRWFGEGVGLLQEVVEHHGTYDETRKQLLKVTINGKTQSYQLKPARTGYFRNRER